MARQKASADNEGAAEDLRTTIVIPDALDKNLQVFSLRAGTSKNEVIKTALREYLLAQGMRPDERPKVQFTY